jgi:predicted acetyltransferase
MRGLMTRFFDDCNERRDTFAGLFASEASIYGRFGFGTATRFSPVTIERAYAAGIEQIATGSIRWLRIDEAADELAGIFERTRGLRPGEILRSDSYWKEMRERAVRNADRQVWVAIHDGRDGVGDGYAVYRMESKWIDHTAHNEVHVHEVVGDGPVRLALWRFVLELDLVRVVTHHGARTDEPLHDVLTDPRQLRTTGVFDGLQLRVVDVEQALSRRAYALDGAITITVDDPVLPHQSGTWRIEVIDGHTKVEHITNGSEADITTSPRGLATAYLGDRSWRSLAGSGLVRIGNGARNAALADAMFAVSPAPECLTTF